jgi:hypothetical protein
VIARRSDHVARAYLRSTKLNRNDAGEWTRRAGEAVRRRHSRLWRGTRLRLRSINILPQGLPSRSAKKAGVGAEPSPQLSEITKLSGLREVLNPSLEGKSYLRQLTPSLLHRTADNHVFIFNLTLAIP